VSANYVLKVSVYKFYCKQLRAYNHALTIYSL